MKYNKHFVLIFISIIFIAVSISCIKNSKSANTQIIEYKVDIKSDSIDFYWKDDSEKIIRSIHNLRKYVGSKNLELLFAVNGGMYDSTNTPQGLFIQNFKTLTQIDTTLAKGNFYLKPNGVFYITSDNLPFICKTEDFINDKRVKYATQSGPMLVIDGNIHPAFNEKSTNLNIRNGVGILPDNRVVFAMSKTKINFYDFAMYFKKQGCKDALYLDGYVSRTYYPEMKWMQIDGNFGVIIGVTKSITN